MSKAHYKIPLQLQSNLTALFAGFVRQHNRRYASSQEQANRTRQTAFHDMKEVLE